MSWWKSRKCKLCRKKIPKNVEAAEVRVGIEDSSILTIEICDECADFFDKSADILRKKHEDRRSDPDSEEEPGGDL